MSKSRQTGNLVSNNSIFVNSNGDVGIGTDNIPLKLTVVGNVRAGYDPNIGVTLGLSPVGIPTNDANSYILWGTDTTFGGINGDLIYVPRTSAGASHRFYAGSPTPSEKVRILAGGGLTFNGDTAAANALDDYEEGTWTPTIQGYTGATGQSYDIQNGYYKKIGSMVFLSYDVRLTTLGTLTGTYVVLGGLPFSNGLGGNVAGTITVGYYSGWSIAASTHITAYLSLNTAYLLTPNGSDGQNYILIADGEATNSSRLIGTMTYLLDG